MYPIEPNTGTDTQFSLKYASEVESSGKATNLSVYLILNVIEVPFRFIGTHFDHNRNTIKIFNFPVGLCTSFGRVAVT